MKTCIRCNKNLPLSKFKYVNKDQYNKTCKKCLKPKKIKRIVKPQWLMDCLKRDNNKCIKCESTEYLVVHHLDESRKLGYKNMNNELNNLITLCKHHHAIIHKQHLRYSKPNKQLIIELRKQGKTYKFIADYLGVSRQRIHQIIKKTILI